MSYWKATFQNPHQYWDGAVICFKVEDPHPRFAQLIREARSILGGQYRLHLEDLWEVSEEEATAYWLDPNQVPAPCDAF